MRPLPKKSNRLLWQITHELYHSKYGSQKKHYTSTIRLPVMNSNTTKKYLHGMKVSVKQAGELLIESRSAHVKSATPLRLLPTYRSFLLHSTNTTKQKERFYKEQLRNPRSIASSHTMKGSVNSRKVLPHNLDLFKTC